MQFNLDDDVKFILEQLNRNGKGFLVGGAVRDKILNKDPGDYDFATDIEYSELKRIFAGYNPKEMGAHFGILMINVNGKSYEIAKFRKETGVYNSRYPKDIKFVKTIQEDLARRDFTINSIAYSEQTGIVDLYGGRQDIRRKVIRFVGKPKLRIEEDALRILRAFRFISKLGFNLDKKTAEAIYKKRKFLTKISKERIFDELSKILMGKFVKKAFIEMKKLRVLEMIIPEFYYAYNFDQNNPNHPDDLFNHIIKVIHLCDYDLVTRFAALFHDLGKINVKIIDAKGIFYFYGHEKESALIAEEELKQLKASNDFINSVKKIVKNHMLIYQDVSDKTLKKLIIEMEEKNLKRLFNLFSADLNSKGLRTKKENEEILQNFREKIENIKKQGKIPQFNDLDITGIDLINLKFSNREIGEVKNRLYELVLGDEIENEKEALLKYVVKHYKLNDNFEYENSCGAIVFNENTEKILLVKMHNGNWGFPKGHIEKDETKEETAIREVLEETNVRIKIIPNFEREIKYIPNEKTIKKVTIFMGITEDEEVTIDTFEIEDFKWCTYEEALKLVTYKLQKDVLENARKVFIKSKTG
ncbi:MULTISPECIES: NUDIX domain-containing protein [unclassified Leptotrichia]|jgi:polyA polymerase|uniref:NUDIX domain-containing protein n=1 Tax=unclassified Leptotrichia TaxID=2633022 RepID=UPI0003AE305C|nr:MULTISPECIES: NUDIX domain-containing protein [unclassified Leptotrichia]ERL24998.1 tRNA nucleotidyltransferase/poly(A) polymerase family protein [Leptotrichia sp. oral taxon 225 str. F0581]WLD75167.1 NUDIX domain-containing protein [Leptotrichia sp. HMT-225]